jgi:hypothetical protein
MQYFYWPIRTKGFQAVGEASKPPKRTSITTKHEFSSLLFWVIFAFLDPDPKHSVDLSEIPLGRSWVKTWMKNNFVLNLPRYQARSMLEEVANYFSESDLMVAAVNCWYPTSDCAKVLACSLDTANIIYF